ncbi:MAG: hypothetical protein VKM92_03925 [Cyanobacteriota bacterium]|nr:hypothetical protein [Cyanobacteriota bacterium]
MDPIRQPSAQAIACRFLRASKASRWGSPLHGSVAALAVLTALAPVARSQDFRVFCTNKGDGSVTC